MGFLVFLIQSMCILLDLVDIILIPGISLFCMYVKTLFKFYMELLTTLVGFGIHAIVALVFLAIKAATVCWVNELSFLWLKIVYG